MATQVAFSDLDSWLSNQPANTSSTPYELNITGLTANDIGYSTTSGTLGYVLKQNDNKYVDLSDTVLPDGITSMRSVFDGCSSLVESPAIPSGVTNLMRTFYNCSSLVDAPIIPNSVTNLGYTFNGCTALTTAPVIPNSVTVMAGTFNNCQYLVNAPVIPDSVTDMSRTFSFCVTLVNAPVIPSNVTNMEETFKYCNNLSHKPIMPSSVTTSTDCYYSVLTNNWKGTESQIESYRSTLTTLSQSNSFEVQVYDTDKETLLNTSTWVYFSNLNSWLENQPANTIDTPYTITVTGLTSSNIGSSSTNGTLGYVLGRNNTKYVDLSETVLPGTTSMVETFKNCSSLTAAPAIPDSVTNMSKTFENCQSLTTVPAIPDSVTNMTETFEGCTALTNAPAIPSSVTNMSYTFCYCTSLVTAPAIPSSVTNMQGTFKDCISLTTAPVIPDSVTDMSQTFENCQSLTAAPAIPSSVTNMSYTFWSCILLTTAPVIPDSVTRMTETFEGCTALTNAPIIPNSVTNMFGTFTGCTLLDYKPIIPINVTTSDYCYQNVTTRNWKGTEEQLGYFNSHCPDDCEVQVYNSDRVTYEYSIYNIDITTLSTYLAGLDANTAATAYKIYIRSLTTSNVSDIKTALISNNQKYVDLSYTIIPSGSAWDYLFQFCNTLVVSPNIPTGVTNLNGTYSGCSSMQKSPVIPNSVTSMQETYMYCSSLDEAPIISSGVTNIRSTFYGCSSLIDSPVLPNGATNLYQTFAYCNNLKNPPVIPSNVAYMRETFAYCISLESAPVLPNGLIDIESAFEFCSNLVTPPAIPSTVTNMDSTFKGCASLGSVAQTPTGVALYEANLDNNRRPTGAIGNKISDYAETAYNSYIGDDYSSRYGATGFTQKNIEAFDIVEGYNPLQVYLFQNTSTSEYYLIQQLIYPYPNPPISVINLRDINANSTGDIEYEYRLYSTDSEISISGGGTLSEDIPVGTDITFTNNSEDDYLPTGTYRVKQQSVAVVSTMGGQFVPNITLPSAVTDIEEVFSGCTSIKEIQSVPSTVTQGKGAFKNCTTLRNINEFKIPLASLDSSDFQNMFDGCTSLTLIGHKVDPSTNLHLVYLNFDSNSVEGKIYSRDKTSVSITQTSITKTTLTLPILTDELLFDTSSSTSDIEDVIEGTAQQKGMLDTHYSWFGKLVIPPTGDYFVLYAKDKNKFRTNLEMGGGADIDVYDTQAQAEADLPNHEVGDFVATEEGGDGVIDAVQDGVLRPVTSNAVADALSTKQNKLYTYNGNFTLTTSQLSSYGYVSANIPTTITNDNVLAVYVDTGQVSASNGFQLTPIFAGNGTLYFNYYRPSAFAQASITFYFRVTYF